MKKIVQLLVLGAAFLLPSLVWAEDGFTVAGEVMFSKTGNIFLQLVTKEQYEKDTEAEFRIILEVGEEEQKAQKIAFTLEDVPAGTYAIIAFQDVNGNEKLDSGTFGPKEPWGMYRYHRPKFKAPKFDKMAFELKDNISDVSIEVKK